jgi:hypothetical protein
MVVNCVVLASHPLAVFTLILHTATKQKAVITKDAVFIELTLESI